MDEWYRMVQTIVEDIDRHIRKRDDEALTLSALSQKLGFSEFYISRKFREIPGCTSGIICATAPSRSR